MFGIQPYSTGYKYLVFSAVLVNELTQLVRAREEVYDQQEAEVAKGQELLEHGRDIRELMGAREL